MLQATRSGTGIPSIDVEPVEDALLEGLGRHLSAPLLKFALKELTASVSAMQDDAQLVPLAPVIVESPHEYLNNMSTATRVHMPGCVSMTAVFDPRSRTETGCDIVQLRASSLPASTQYSGSKFPGAGLPPLVIRGDTCEVLFKSDGSTTFWGYRITFTGTRAPAPATAAQAAQPLPHRHSMLGLDASCFLVRAALTHGPRWISASDVLEHVTSALQGLISLHSPALPRVLAILPGLAHAVSAQPRAQPNVAQLRHVLEQATLAAYMDEQSTGNKSRVLKQLLEGSAAGVAMSPPSAAAPKLPEGSTEYSRARKGCLDLVASIATLTTMVANLVDSKVPVQWINQQCISEAVPMHTTVLESPPGHNCLTLAGAQPGGADADSKEAEEERESKVCEGAPEYVRVRVPHASGLVVTLDPASRLPPNRQVFAKVEGDFGPGRRVGKQSAPPTEFPGATSILLWLRDPDPHKPCPRLVPPAAGYSYKITVSPLFNAQDLAEGHTFASTVEARVAEHQKWSLDADCGLIQWIQQRVQGLGLGDPLTVPWEKLDPLTASPSPAGGASGPSTDTAIQQLLGVAHFCVPAPPSWGPAAPATAVVQARHALLMSLNRLVREVLPYVDWLERHCKGTLANLLSRARGLLLVTTRLPLWERAISATQTPQSSLEALLASMGSATSASITLELNHMQAQELAARNEVDVQGRVTVFAQAFRSLHFTAPKSLRYSRRLYSVVDRSPVNLSYGLDAVDAGGPYRFSFSTYCRELQSPVLTLLLPVPNARNHVGDNRDTFLPNPDATRPVEVQMLEFMGKLLGIAIRSKEYLDLNLPPLFWKKLVGEPVGAADLESVDVVVMQALREVQAAPREHPMFTGAPRFFTVPNLSGAVVPVVPGGSTRPLTYDNRMEYVEAVLRCRLGELDRQMDAIRAGVACIVPARLLCLFTGAEVEEMVCGSVTVDVEMLRRTALYEGCSSSDRHVGFFWEAFALLPNPDRRKLVSFAYGRSRLPRLASQLEHRLKLSPLAEPCPGPRDRYLPRAHDCFFLIELPPYTSLQQCREKLAQAIGATPPQAAATVTRS